MRAKSVLKTHPKRNRLAYFLLIFLIAVIAITSREAVFGLPDFLVSYSGDTLWALAVFLCVGIVYQEIGTIRAGMFAFLFSICIELSQLYHSALIDAIRQTSIGGLIFGFEFLWTDFICYGVGISLGMIAELLVDAGESIYHPLYPPDKHDNNHPFKDEV